MQKWILLLVLSSLGWRLPSEGAAWAKRGYADSEQAIAWNETRDTVDSLRHQTENQEIELRMFEQKLDSLSVILESLQDKIDDSASQQKEQLKGRSAAIETKVATLDAAIKSLVSDLKRLQTHANETSSTLDIFKQKLTDLDQKLQTQNENMDNLQAALQTMMEALQVKVVGGGWAGKSHKIRNGDSLEKIARSYGVSIQSIKELNGIASDKIIIGKTLKIPN